MNKFFATALLLTACATTGRTLTSDDHATPTGVRLSLAPPIASDEARPWFPELRSDAVLPNARALQSELIATGRTMFEIGLSICVAPDGSVASVELAKSSTSEALDRVAVEDVQAWRYEPYTAPAHLRVCKAVDLHYTP
jgi:TonB family protein